MTDVAAVNDTLAVPGYVYSVSVPRGGSILLDGRSGRCYTMNGTAHDLWREWQHTGDLESVLEAAVSRNPVYADDRFRADAVALTDLLLAKGLLVPADTSRPPAVTPPARDTDPELPGFRLTALLALPLALVLLRLPFRVTVRLLSWSRSHWSRRGATGAQALAALLATEAAGRHHPGRVACLELSLGAVLAMALRRRQLSLVIGVADDPCRFHAWVAAQDGPVGYPIGSDLTEFRPIAVL